jgi:hypothetical protein
MDSIFEKLNQIRYKKIIWVLVLSETIHNIEEAIWLPGWSQTAGVWHPPVTAFEFRIAVAIITLAVYWIIYYYSRHDNRPAAYLMGGTLAVILFNVFIPHLAATMVAARYAPGVVSGILLNVPIAVYVLWRGLKEGEYTVKTLAAGSVAVILIAMPLMLASFALGRFIEKI